MNSKANSTAKLGLTFLTSKYRLLMVVLGGLVLLFSAKLVIGRNAVSEVAVVSAQRSNITIDTNNRGVVRYVPDNLFAVDFVDEKIGWVAGYYGTILKTEDGGKTWRHISLPFTDLIRRIDFIDENIGWVVTHRGRILKTTDGGLTWEVQHQEKDQERTVNLRNVSFFNADIGWAIGHEATIFRTQDGGITWQKRPLDNYTKRDIPRLSAILIVSEKHVFLGGEFGTIAETLDGGETWNVISPIDFNATITSMATANGQVLAVGLNGVAMTIAVDPEVCTGQTAPCSRFEILETNTPSHLFDVKLNSDGSGIAVGLGNVLVVDHGRNFTNIGGKLPGIEFMFFNGVSGINQKNIVMVGSGGLVMRVDATSQYFERLVKW